MPAGPEGVVELIPAREERIDRRPDFFAVDRAKRPVAGKKIDVSRPGIVCGVRDIVGDLLDSSGRRQVEPL